jgi:hypothetical protein
VLRGLKRLFQLRLNKLGKIALCSQAPPQKAVKDYKLKCEAIPKFAAWKKKVLHVLLWPARRVG